MTFKTWVQNGWKQFLSSLKKLDKTYFKILLYDFLFFLVLILSFMLWNVALNYQATKLPALETATVAEAGDVLSAFKNFIISLILFSLVLFILIIINSSLFKGLAWSKVLNKKYDSKTFKNLFLANLFLIPIYLILVIAFFMILTKLNPTIVIQSLTSKILLWLAFTPIMLLIVMPLMFYVTESINIIYMRIIEKERIWLGVKEGIKSLVSPKLYLPYFFASVLLTILLFIIYPFGAVKGVTFVLSTIVMLLVGAWIKLYIAGTLSFKRKAKK